MSRSLAPVRRWSVDSPSHPRRVRGGEQAPAMRHFPSSGLGAPMVQAPATQGGRVVTQNTQNAAPP